jgi:hypothetical protein
MREGNNELERSRRITLRDKSAEEVRKQTEPGYWRIVLAARHQN